MTKLEEIARAIAIASRAFTDHELYSMGVPDNVYGRECAEKLARAAVEALREPSGNVVQEGYRLAQELRAKQGDTHADDLWKCMIDAILNEKPV